MPFTMLVHTMNVFLPFRTVSLYYYFLVMFFVAKKDCRFQENGLWRGYVDDFAFYILLFYGSVVMFLLLYSCLLLYLTLHPEYFEVEQICFSCLMVYFDKIDVFTFVWFLFSTFVWRFHCLMFPSDVLLIFLPHTYHGLSLLFSSFSVSISLFSIPISSFSVYAGIAWWM